MHIARKKSSNMNAQPSNSHGHIGLQTQAWTSRDIQPEMSYHILSFLDFQETSRRFPRHFQEIPGEEFPRKWRPGDLQSLPSCINSGEARGGSGEARGGSRKARRATYRANIVFRPGNIAFRKVNIAFRIGDTALSLGNIAFRIGNLAFRLGNIAVCIVNSAFRTGNIAFRLRNIAF